MLTNLDIIILIAALCGLFAQWLLAFSVAPLVVMIINWLAFVVIVYCSMIKVYRQVIE